jgi:hypothetical protein
MEGNIFTIQTPTVDRLEIACGKITSNDEFIFDP